MDIGKKIKMLRTEKLMTQSELAGNEITRNMLSQIENGSAFPSLSTVVYLASRLGVPSGFLLSEGDEEFIYNKISAMKNIKKAYKDRNFEICREMCISSFDEYDDELELILTDCCIGVAEEYIKDGKLRLAREMLDEAIRHSKKTIYSTVCQINRIFVMFHLLKNISPSLDSDEIDTECSTKLIMPSLFVDVLCKYISLIFGSEDSDETILSQAEDISEYDRLFILHIGARQRMSMGDYRGAASILKSIIDGELVPQKMLLYLCCGDMEKCCKEMDDYRGAYEFSNNKMDILEHMLAEI